MLSNRIYILIRNLLDDSSEEVLIIDDSPYDRSGLKKWNFFPVSLIIQPIHTLKLQNADAWLV